MARSTVDLPEPDSPTMPNGLAGRDLEGDVAHRRQRASPDAEGDAAGSSTAIIVAMSR